MPLEFPVLEPFELKREKPPGFTLEVPSDFNPGEFKLDLPDPLPDGELEFEPPWASLVSSPSQSKHAGARR